MLDPGIFEYSDTGLTLGKNYYYRARGVWKTTNLPYSNIQNVSTAILMTIAATGTGAAIGVLRVRNDDEITISLDGNGKFYTNEAGTEGESATKKLSRGAQYVYFKCTSGSANLKFPKNSISQIESYVAGTNCPSLGGNLTPLSELVVVSIAGNNTVSGDVSKLKKIISLYVAGTNTLSGSITNLTSLTYLSVAGNNTISGSISNLVKLTFLRILGQTTIGGSISNLTELTYLYIYSSVGVTVTGSLTLLTKLNYLRMGVGSNISGDITNLILLTNIQPGATNSITGDISKLTELNTIDALGLNTLYGSIDALNKLSYLTIDGNNAIEGDLKNISSVLTRCYIIGGRMVNYTSGGNWSKITAGGTITIKPDTGYGLSSSEVDLLLQEISATKVEGRAITVDLRGANQARTSASDAAVADIVTDGGTVQTN